MLISIYKIYCIDESIEDIYIGSTINIKNRLMGHKTSCNNIKGKTYNLKVYQFIRNNGGFDNWRMEVIHEAECETNRDKEQIEQEYINTCKPKLNERKSYMTEKDLKQQKKQYNKERYQKNKEKINQYNNEYRAKNKEKIKKRKREYYLKNKK